MKKKFIKAANEYCTFEKHISAPYFRRNFELDFVPDEAEISICGLGFYHLYINGVDITKGEFAPYISNVDHICYYDKYDISKELKQGKNTVAVLLGNGFYNSFGGVIWDFDKAEWRNPPSLALEFYAKNSLYEFSFDADEDFKVYSSPIIFDELRMGEYYDANLEIEGWNLPEFDDNQWNNAITASAPRGIMKLCEVEPIKHEKEIIPVSITQIDDGYLYDFGENNAGVCRLCINANKGQKIVLWHGEELDNGRLNTTYIRYHSPNAKFYDEYFQKDIYIAKGVGTEVYMPKFTYHGFRYVYVTGITVEQATSSLLTYVVMHSDIEVIGGFDCSDAIVNKIYEMTVRSDMSNYYYFPTDCPHREKNGWTGDIVVSAAHMVRMYDVEKSWSEYLCNVRKSQLESGELPGIVPTAGWGYEWGNGPGWDNILFELPYQLYKCRGNTEIIKSNASAMMRYLEFVIKKRNINGTVAIGLGDWAPTGKTNNDIAAPLELTDSILIVDMAKKAYEMFNAIGYEMQAIFAKSIFDDMRATIRRELIDLNNMVAAGDCQTSQAMAIYYDIFSDTEKQKAFEYLVKLIHKNDNKFDSGYQGLRVIFQVLSDFGESELAYEMITADRYPSYGHLISTGQTTLPEKFMPDDEPCGSRNHHFLGDVARWFIENIAGLSIVNSEYICIKPNFIKKLNYAKAEYLLPSGKVEVSWEKNGNKIELLINSPVPYELVLPDNCKWSKESNIVNIITR